ncbi:MAG: 2-succinyl-5-enolpyruvyl-6-hydroxy-3-cyclohexene-1-carboxylate synthase, partial [Candidatus Eisenbacteria bacterium]|nr:2-succinyl-5-enolpyruvyl-6-hydroxy-3-cyclohexene-1-carboxylate synthase [Candidatus Eisenbacteria bacterium]
MPESGNRSQALATALAEEFARCGVRHVAAGSGSRSTPLLLALDAVPSIRIWTHLDERCAGFFALGLA